MENDYVVPKKMKQVWRQRGNWVHSRLWNNVFLLQWKYPRSLWKSGATNQEHWKLSSRIKSWAIRMWNYLGLRRIERNPGVHQPLFRVRNLLSIFSSENAFNWAIARRVRRTGLNNDLSPYGDFLWSAGISSAGKTLDLKPWSLWMALSNLGPYQVLKGTLSPRFLFPEIQPTKSSESEGSMTMEFLQWLLQYNLNWRKVLRSGNSASD